MNRLLLLLLLAVVFASVPRAQESEPDAAPADETEAEVEGESAEEESALADVTDEEIEELLGLDEDYAENDDDFDPTEEVRFEQSIPFPVDI